MTAERVDVRSVDGTRIAAFRRGTGPPLLLVHGTTADHARWNITRPRLEARFTVYAMDRRGRGGSGDTPSYSLDKEAQDVASIVDSIGGPVDVLGHSYGGLCALEAAMLTSNVGRLIAYEPAAFIPGSGVYGDEVLERLEWMLGMGDHEGLVATMLREVAGIPAETIDLLRRQPYWATRVATAPTIPRELRADAAYSIDAARLRRIKAKTLLLLGGASPSFYREGALRLRDAIPGARIEELPGQGHAAMDTANRLFVDSVMRFLNE